MTATTQALAKGLNQAQSALGSFAKGLVSLKGLVAGAFTGAGIATLGHFASLADDLSDNIEKMRVMFGSASDDIVKQAEKMNAAFGTSEIAFTDAAVKMGGLMKSLGVAEGPAAAMTNQLLVLGQAIANFKGISLEEAMTKVQAGMAGKGKALKEFGINVKATMSAQERFNALMQGGAGIIGAMSERAMDAGNSWREFRGRLEEIEITLGQHLPEMVEPFFKELNVGIVAASEWFKGLNSDTLDWGESSLTSAKSAAEGFGWVQQSVGFVADAFQVATNSFHAFRSELTEGLSVVVGWVSSFLKGLDKIFDMLGLVDKYNGKTLPSAITGAGGPTDFLDAWSKGLGEASRKEMDDLRKDWAKPWASEGINAAFDAERKKIDEARKDVMKPALAAGKIPDAIKQTEMGKAAGAALAAGGVGTASVLLKGQYQLGDEAHKKKMEKNSDAQVKLLGDIKANLEAGNGEPELWDGL